MFSRKKGRRIPSWFIALMDALLVNFALLLAFLIRFQGVLPAVNINPFYQLVPYIAVATVVFFDGLGLYKRNWEGLNISFRAIAVALLFLFLLTNTATFWLRGFAFPRSVLILGFVLQLIFVIAWRWGCWYLDRLFHGSLRVAVLGDNVDKSLLEKIMACGKGHFRVTDVISSRVFITSKKKLEEADAFLVLPSFSEEQKMAILNMSLSRRKPLFLVPRIYDIILSNAEISQIDDLPILEVSNFRPSNWFLTAKRLMDIAIAGLGLVATFPLLAVIALAIKATSSGPIFYVQERIGQEEKPFLLYKFRTMIDNAEAYTGPTLATSSDPRVTPVGKILRATRLDELPQLWNVLKGDMSLVGPRPERFVFVERFKREIPGYEYRHLVKPGLTGFAQIAGKYSTNASDKLRYDLFYIRNLSLLQDVKILMQTIPVVLSREAAEGCSMSSLSCTSEIQKAQPSQ